jgi:hypothetical protein
MSDPTRATIAAYDAHASDFAAKWFARHEVDAYLDHVAGFLRAGARIIDIGCGSGRDTSYLAAKGFDCIGVDLSEGLLREARTRSPDHQFRMMDARTIRYPTGMFDAALLLAVIVHMHRADIIRVLLETRRVLRADGIVAITFNVGEGADVCSLGRQRVYHQPREVQELLREGGFELISMDTEQSGRPDGQVWAQMVARVVKQEDSDSVTDCNFCPSALLPENSVAKVAQAGSVLWGDDDYYVALDVAPLCIGHTLIITRQHDLSLAASPLSNARIRDCEARLIDLHTRAFGVAPLFVEHGSSDTSRRKSCVVHAHVHVLPVGEEVRTAIMAAVHPLRGPIALSAERLRLATTEYVTVGSSADELFVRTDDLEGIQPQFFRRAHANLMGLTEETWMALRGKPASNLLFEEGLQKMIAELDSDVRRELDRL